MEKRFRLSAQVKEGCRLLSIICLFSVAAGCAAAFLRWKLSLPLAIWLCFCAGVIHRAGVLLKRRREAGAALGLSFVLLLAVLGPRGMAVEVSVAYVGYCMMAFLDARDKARRFCIGLAAVLLAAAFFRGYSIPKALVLAVLFLCLEEWVSLYGRELGVALVPYLLVMAAVLCLLPVRNAPLDWSALIRLGGRAGALGRTLYREAEYRLGALEGRTSTQSGYAALNELGGALRENGREELYLSDRDTRGNLYLTGALYTRLEGERWEREEGRKQPDGAWYIRYLNLLYQSGVTREEALRFSSACAVELTYGYLRTRDVIRPEHLLYLEASPGAELPEYDDAYVFQERQGKSLRYRAHFLEFDYASSVLEALINKAGETEETWASYEELAALSLELYQIPLDWVADREAYRAAQREVPSADVLDTDGTTERVRALAREITAGCQSAYESCRAVEAYLRQYPYEADTDLRGYESFVDAFLFEKQQGYCVHYASAMVQLLRAVGIPARLASGYCCDYEKSREYGGYMISGDDAHVWPEAYLSGWGWVPFEPTANRTNGAVTSWEQAEENLGQGMASPATGDRKRPKSVPLPEAAPSAVRDSAASAGWLPVVLPIVAVLGAVIVSLLLYLAARRLRFWRMDSRGKLEAVLGDILWLIQVLCSDGGKGKLLLDYAGTLPEEELRQEAREVFLGYYGVRYRRQEAGRIYEKALALRGTLQKRCLEQEGGHRWKRKLAVWLRMSGVH